MQFNAFSSTWNRLSFENRLFRLTIPGLVLLLIITTMGWLSKERTVVMVPPSGVFETMEVSNRAASASYKKPWATFIAHVMGNVHPGNADMMLETVSGLMSAQTYQDVRNSIAESLARIKNDGISIAFEPKNVIYETASDKVFVAGRSTVSGAQGVITKYDTTFEMTFSVQSMSPKVQSLKTYQGPPMTLDRLARMGQDPSAVDAAVPGETQ